MKKNAFFLVCVFLCIFAGCRKSSPQNQQQTPDNPQSSYPKTGGDYPVKLITLDPGHFHAALVQKTMLPQISPEVCVYAPPGPDAEQHLARIEAYNSRSDNPTAWKEIVYTGDDYLQKMLEEKRGNVVVISGSNSKKAQYIKACVQAGLHVLADKPMCIDPEGFDTILQACEIAKKNNVLIYDIMTERSEITTILQKELSQIENVFGALEEGSPDDPAVVKESVHHFFKYVSGEPLKRPAWYFDTAQQGEGIVDVTTHLLDLVMWEAYPDRSIDYTTDIRIFSANHRPTMITLPQFQKVTGLDDFPQFLKAGTDEAGVLPCYANGKIIFKLKDTFAEVSVVWNYQAPEGAGDTHYSVMKGTRADIIIRQGKEQNYKPELYIEPAENVSREEFAGDLASAVTALSGRYEGITLQQEQNAWHITIPEKYRIGHEAHFAQVMERFLGYLEKGSLPDWELAGIKAKYFTTTRALELAKTAKPETENKIRFVTGTDKIDVFAGDVLLAGYMFGDNLTKPALYPLNTLSGVTVTRGYPFAEIKGESTDHPHHTGLFFTYGDVNKTDFWTNTDSPPMIKTIRSEIIAPGSIHSVSHWLDKDNAVVLEENRTMSFRTGPECYSIDFDITLTAQDREVVFGDTKEGMFALRTADWLTEEKGTGRYFDSKGRQTEKNVWGRRAEWLCLEGKKDDKTIGVAIFNHPDSVNFPTFWMARGYGLYAANPLGQLIYMQTNKEPDPTPFNLTLQPRQSAKFKFEVLIYEGPQTPQQLNDIFNNFIRPAASN